MAPYRHRAPGDALIEAPRTLGDLIPRMSEDPCANRTGAIPAPGQETVENRCVPNPAVHAPGSAHEYAVHNTGLSHPAGVPVAEDHLGLAAGAPLA